MTKEAKGALTINVMGREFRVAVPAGEQQQLIASADYLNQKMREIRETGKIIGSERIAVMAALNIAHEYLQLSANQPIKSSVDSELIKRKMKQFEGAIEKALTDQEKLF